MTPRARAYLIIAGLRHVGIGVCAVAVASSFSSSSLRPLLEVMNLPTWGFFLIIVGLSCLSAALMESEPIARAALVLSAAASATWTAGFLSAALNHELPNPALPIVFAALAAKDLVVCAQPLRSPFERLAQSLGDDTPA
jgi:hypothetical protein